jgi:hypothetical protein
MKVSLVGSVSPARRAGKRRRTMMHREWNRVSMTVALVGLLPGLCLGIVATPARAHSDWALPFMGGLMAGHVATNFAMAQRERTEALRSMAYGGEGGGYGRPMPYGYGPPRPTYAAPAAPSPEQQLNTLDQLAAGGYITPEEYRARRQAILNSM